MARLFVPYPMKSLRPNEGFLFIEYADRKADGTNDEKDNDQRVNEPPPCFKTNVYQCQ